MAELMSAESVLNELALALPPGAVISDPSEMDAYRWDRANDPAAGIPLAVALPTTTEEVQSVVRVAAASGTAIVPRGAGSGLSGGSSAIDGCIVISLERMRTVAVDVATRIATAQPGAFNADVKRAAAAHGLWYPPDPASFEFCSIGGNVATNAGGLCCVKYGVTTDYVLGMTVVLADGRAVRLGGPRVKDVAGLSLTKLFVGSEGTLGIITEVILRLIPAQRQPTTLIATFPTLAGTMDAVIAITQSARPSMLEFMDRTCINAVEDSIGAGLDRSAEAMLVIQSDEHPDAAAEEIAAMAAICRAMGATECLTPSDPDVAETYVAARRAAIPAVEQLGTLLLKDVGVPIPSLGELALGIQAIAKENDITIALIAHAGDGNTHPLLVFDPADADQAERAEVAYGQVMDLALALGGTITGEHGVGRLKRPWLAEYLGDDVLELNARIKSAFDPAGILNPGAIFERSTS